MIQQLYFTKVSSRDCLGLSIVDSKDLLLYLSFLTSIMNVCLTWEQINDGARHTFITDREKFLLTRVRLSVVALAQDTDMTYQCLKVRLRI